MGRGRDLRLNQKAGYKVYWSKCIYIVSQQDGITSEMNGKKQPL